MIAVVTGTIAEQKECELSKVRVVDQASPTCVIYLPARWFAVIVDGLNSPPDAS